MDFNVLLEDMRIASDNLRKATSNRKYLSSLYCNKTCKAVDKTASTGTEYENVITGLWLITAHLTEQVDHLERVPGVQDVALRLFRECTKAVLNIQWQNLEEDGTLRQSFLISLANLNAKLVNRNFHRFRLLESLTENPWTDPTLAKIMGGEAEDEEEKEEVRKYIENEDPVILQLRVDMMLKENCEEYAMNLCNSCLTHPELKSDLKLRKTQLTLLHKLGHTDRLQEECQKLSIQDALVIIRQLQTRANKEICTVLAQTFMVQNWIRPSDEDANKELLRLWIKQQVQVDKEQDRFKESVWAIAKLSQSTEQVIFFINVLREQCGGTYLQLYVDMCIFAINVDKGQMETSLRQGNSESAIARKSDMAAICSKLACLVHHASVKMARMCVLTAFALKPSEESYESIGKFYGEKHNCCGNCTKNVNADPGTVNPATLYEVERLLNMLRPEYLNPENTLVNVQMLCKRYLQERPKCSKDIFNALPVNSSQVEGPGKKKGDAANSKAYNLYDAVSSHELSSSQVLLSKLRLQSIQNNHPNQPIRKVIYSEPTQPTFASSATQNHGWSNILHTGPQRPSPNEASAEQLGNIFNISKQSFSPSVANSINYRPNFLKQDQQVKLISSSQQSVPQVQARVPQLAASNSQRQQESRFQQQINSSIPTGVQRDSEAAASFQLNSQSKQITRGILNIAGDIQTKSNAMTPIKTSLQQQKVLPTTLRLPQTGKITSQQLGAQGLPTVSTLLKPAQKLEQHHPTSKSCLPLQLSSSSSFALGTTRSETSTQQLLQIRNSNAVESQKSDNLRRIRNLQATLTHSQPQQKQQVFSKQMAGAIVTVNQSAQRPGNVNINLPKQIDLQKSSLGALQQTTILNLQSKLSPKISSQQLFHQKGTHNTQQVTQRQQSQISSQQNQFQLTLGKNQRQQFDLAMSGSRESLQFPSHSSVTISSEPDSLNTQNQSALSSDELSGSITGIDDTIIKELLQDSGIFSNTFPDIEVEDLNKKSQGALQSAVSNRIYSPSRLSTIRSQAKNIPICETNLMQNPVISWNAKRSSTSNNFAPSDDLKPSNALLQFKPVYKEPHVDSNTLNQRQFPDDIKPNVATISLSQTAESASNLTTVEQLREKMRKEQIEGEVMMDASNNATYRCIICSLAFGELEELREHVRNVCKPGLQSSSVYNNKIEQDRAKSAKAGLETTTVFQCLRCFELCISDVGIKQHRSTCKRVPTVPPDIKNATMKGKTSPSACSSRSSTPKSLPKKDNSSKVPEMPLPFPYPSLNTKAVLESLSAATGKSQTSPQSGTTCVVTSPPDKMDSITSSVAAKDSISTRENSSKTEKSKAMPPPSYSEISGSGGSKFYRCKVCSQTLCSLESLYCHWKECSAKNATTEKKIVHKSFLYDDDLEPGEIRPLFGRMLENVMSVITAVAHGDLGNTGDFDSDAEASDFEVLVELEDPSKAHQKSKKPPFHKEFPSINVAVFQNNFQNIQQISNKDLTSNSGSVTTRAPNRDKSRHLKARSHKYEDSHSVHIIVSNDGKLQSGKKTDLRKRSEKTDFRKRSENAEDSSSMGEGDGNQSLEGFEVSDEDLQDSLRETTPKLRDRNTLKPIQSFINESFVSPYCKTGDRKASILKKKTVAEGNSDAASRMPSGESGEESFICVACKKLCPSERILIQHYAGKHLMPYTMKTLADGNSYFCHLCQKSFTTFKHYMLHVPNHKNVIFDKMKYSSPRRGTARPWSIRLASSRGLVSRQLGGKKGKLSPKLASALKSKKKAAKSARDRLRKCLSKKSSIHPSLLLHDREDSSNRASTSDKKAVRSLSFSGAKRPLPRNHLTRRCQSFIQSLSQSENDDSCPSSNHANTDDEDYWASEDLDSDSSPSAPPQTRYRKRSGQNLPSIEDSKRRKSVSATSDSTENNDQNLFPVVSVRRISEQEIEKYSKSSDHTQENGSDVLDPVPELPSPSMSSFQASFESYIKQSLDPADQPKQGQSTSFSPQRPPIESSVCSNGIDQDESNASSDQTSLADTEASTVSYATDASQGAVVKGGHEADEILSSVTNRRCSVNLGQKLDINTIQILSESTSDKAVLEETPTLPQEEDTSKSDSSHVQQILFNCAVRLERTELVDRLLASAKEGTSLPITCENSKRGTEENADETKLSEGKFHLEKEAALSGQVNVKEDFKLQSDVNLLKEDVVVKQEEDKFGNFGIQSSNLSSTASVPGDMSISGYTKLKLDKAEGNEGSLENMSVENERLSVSTPHHNDNKLKDSPVSSVNLGTKLTAVAINPKSESILDRQETILNDMKAEDFTEDETQGECSVSKMVSQALCSLDTAAQESSSFSTGDIASGSDKETLLKLYSQDMTLSIDKQIVPLDSFNLSMCDGAQDEEDGANPQPVHSNEREKTSSTNNEGMGTYQESVNEITNLSLPALDSDSRSCDHNTQELCEETPTFSGLLSDEEMKDSNSELNVTKSDSTSEYPAKAEDTSAMCPLTPEKQFSENSFNTEVSGSSLDKTVDSEGGHSNSVCGQSSDAVESCITSQPQSPGYMDSDHVSSEMEMHEIVKFVAESSEIQSAESVSSITIMPEANLNENVTSSDGSTIMQSSRDVTDINSNGEACKLYSGKIGFDKEASETWPSENVNSDLRVPELPTSPSVTLSGELSEVCSSANTNSIQEPYETHSESVNANEEPSAILTSVMASESETSGCEQESSEDMHASKNVSSNEELPKMAIETKDGNTTLETPSCHEKEEECAVDNILMNNFPDFDGKIDKGTTFDRKQNCKLHNVEVISSSEFDHTDNQADTSGQLVNDVATREGKALQEQQMPQGYIHEAKDREAEAQENIADSSLTTENSYAQSFSIKQGSVFALETKDTVETDPALTAESDFSFKDLDMISSSGIISADDNDSEARDNVNVMKYQTVEPLDFLTSVSQNLSAITETERTENLNVTQLPIINGNDSSIKSETIVIVETAMENLRGSSQYTDENSISEIPDFNSIALDGADLGTVSKYSSIMSMPIAAVQEDFDKVNTSEEQNILSTHQLQTFSSGNSDTSQSCELLVTDRPLDDIPTEGPSLYFQKQEVDQHSPHQEREVAYPSEVSHDGENVASGHEERLYAEENESLRNLEGTLGLKKGCEEEKDTDSCNQGISAAQKTINDTSCEDCHDLDQSPSAESPFLPTADTLIAESTVSEQSKENDTLEQEVVYPHLDSASQVDLSMTWNVASEQSLSAESPFLPTEDTLIAESSVSEQSREISTLEHEVVDPNLDSYVDLSMSGNVTSEQSPSAESPFLPTEDTLIAESSVSELSRENGTLEHEVVNPHLDSYVDLSMTGNVASEQSPSAESPFLPTEDTLMVESTVSEQSKANSILEQEVVYPHLDLASQVDLSMTWNVASEQSLSAESPFLPTEDTLIIAESSVSEQSRENGTLEHEVVNPHLDSYVDLSMSGNVAIEQSPSAKSPFLPTEDTLIAESTVSEQSRENGTLEHEVVYPHVDSHGDLSITGNVASEQIVAESVDLLSGHGQISHQSSQSLQESPTLSSVETHVEYQSLEEHSSKTSYPSEDLVSDISSMAAAGEQEFPAVQALDDKQIQKTVEEENSRSDEVPQSMDCSELRQLTGQPEETPEKVAEKEEGSCVKHVIASVNKVISIPPESLATEEPNSAEENLVVSKNEMNNGRSLSEPFENWNDVHTMGKENSVCDTEKDVFAINTGSKKNDVQITDDEEKYSIVDRFMSDGFEETQSEKVCDSFRGQKIELEVKDELIIYNDKPKKVPKPPAADEDDLSDYDLFIEEDTSYNKNVFNQALMPKGPRKEKANKPPSHSAEGKDRFSVDEDNVSAKMQFQQFPRGVKSLKEKLGSSRFEWDDFDEEMSARHSKEASMENARLLERKQNALKGKSESSPFMWDLEDSPEKQEQQCAGGKTVDSDIRKSLCFENLEKDYNEIAVAKNHKQVKRRGRAIKVESSDCKEKLQPKKRMSSFMKNKPKAKIRKLANVVSPLTLPAPTQTTPIRQRHRSSESPSTKTKPAEDISLFMPNIKSVNDVIVDDEISFNTKSYSPIPPEIPSIKASEMRPDLKKTLSRGRRKSKKQNSSGAKAVINPSPEPKSMNEDKKGKMTNLTTVGVDNNSSKHQDRDSTLSSESKRIKLSPHSKPTDPLTPKLKKAGLIRVAKQSPMSTPSSTNALPFTRSSEAALKAFNQKSLRNRKVQPTEKQSVSGNSKSPLLQRRPVENFKQNKVASPPSLGSTPARLTGDQSTSNNQSSRKVAKHAAERNETPTAAIVKRRTPSLPRKNNKELFVSTSKRNISKQSTTSMTIYRVDPLPKEAASKAMTSTFKPPSTVHTPLPPGVTTVNSRKKQVKAKWKIDKEMKPTNVKSKQLRSPISFRKT